MAKKTKATETETAREASLSNEIANVLTLAIEALKFSERATLRLHEVEEPGSGYVDPEKQARALRALLNARRDLHAVIGELRKLMARLMPDETPEEAARTAEWLTTPEAGAPENEEVAS